MEKETWEVNCESAKFKIQKSKNLCETSASLVLRGEKYEVPHFVI